jgi:GDPmannose 4,6-dehydratase
VRDFVTLTFDHAGLDWERHVRFDDRYLRPAEVDSLIGDASKARNDLGWTPTVFTPELARIMLEAESRYLESTADRARPPTSSNDVVELSA